MRSSMRVMAGLVGCVALLAQGCADESAPPRGSGTAAGAHPSDPSHPGWRLYPEAVVASQVDPSAIYAFSLEGDKVRLPRAGHEAMIAAIVPGKTVLVSRSNEDDLVKNPGLIRGVLSATNEGADVVYTTVPLQLVDIIRGFLPFGGKEGVHFIKAGTRASAGTKPQSAGVKLQAEGDDLPGDTSWVLNNATTTITVPTIELSSSSYSYNLQGAPDPKHLTIAGSMDVSAVVDTYLEVGATGGINFEAWNGDGGFCVDLGWFGGRHCTGAPLLEGEGHLYISYDFGITPTFGFSGKVERSIDLPELALPPVSCVIPPGIPCFVQGGLGGQAAVSINGAVKFTVDKPYRMYGVAALGGNFRNFDIHITTPDAPHFDGPTKTVALQPEGVIPPGDLAGVGSLNIEAGVEASVEYGPFLRFGVGAPEGANLFVEGTLRYKLGGAASICQNLNSSGYTGAGTTAGASLKRGPEIKATLGGEAPVLGTHSISATLYSGYETFALIGTPGCGGAAQPQGGLPASW